MNTKVYFMKSILYLALSGVLLAACDSRDGRSFDYGEAPSEPSRGWSIQTDGDLNNFFECLEAEGRTLVAAHRGGAYPGYPENALETMANVLDAAPALMEVDVATSADGVLYLMHDDTLDRTTTGSGNVGARNWPEIKNLRLVDDDGHHTSFTPTRFDEALAWSKSRTLLQVDFKETTRYEDVADEIIRQQAEDRVILIATSPASAAKLHRLLPGAMISLSADSAADINSAVAKGVPADKLLAFTGRETPRPRLFSMLNSRNIEVIFGTLGWPTSIDRDIVSSGDEARYAEIASAGVDIIATDRPKEAHAALLAAGRAAENGLCGIVKNVGEQN